MGLGVQGLGLRARGFGFRVWGLGFGTNGICRAIRVYVFGKGDAGFAV